MRRLAALALVVLACASPEERLEEHMERGRAYLLDARPKEALLEFRSALKLRPDDPALYEQVGEILDRMSQDESALGYFEQARRLDPSRVSATMNVARLIAFSDSDRARALVDAALAETPDEAIVHRADAHVALVQRDARRALASARRASELDPDDMANWATLSTVYEALIRERQKRGDKRDDELFRQALHALGRVDELEGGFPRARMEQARLHYVWGRPQKARKLYLDALELAKQQGSLLDTRIGAGALEDFAIEIGDIELRRRALREAIGADPGNLGAWDRLARAAGPRGSDAGDEVYRELLELRPDDGRAHMFYANHLVRRGRPEDAAAHLRRTIDDGLDQPRLWERLLRITIQEARYEDAHAILAELVDRHPGSFAARLGQARLDLAEGRAEQAAGLLEPLLAEEQDDAELWRLMALAQLRMGNLQRARQDIRTAMRLSPQPAFSALRIQARIEYALESWRNTVESYQILLGRGQKLSLEEQLQLAEALYGLERRTAGLEVLEGLLAPAEPDPRVAIAFARLEGDRDPDRAARLLEHAHRRAPGDPVILEAVTEFDVAGGRTPQALARLDRVVTARLASPRTLLLRARLLAAQGEHERAEADVLRAFEADPTLAGAIDLLHAIYTAQGRVEEARRSFEQADEVGVLHAGARLLLARLYLSEGNEERARVMLEKVVAEEPRLWSARNDLAFLLAEAGEDLERALALAREAHVASGYSPNTADTVGYVHLKSGRAQDALAEFSRAIRTTRNRDETVDPVFLYHEGLALQALGRTDEAATAFETALGDGADFPGAEDARRQLEAARHRGSEPASSS